jgi:transposase, IS5 family
MDRNHLKGRDGDRANAILAATGDNFALLLHWLRKLLRALLQVLLSTLFWLPIPANLAQNRR